MFDPRKEITEIKELAEKGETHANELFKRLVALLHDLIHGKPVVVSEVAIPATGAELPTPDNGSPAPTIPAAEVSEVSDPNQQPSNIGGDEPVQEPA